MITVSLSASQPGVLKFHCIPLGVRRGFLIDVDGALAGGAKTLTQAFHNVIHLLKKHQLHYADYQLHTYERELPIILTPRKSFFMNLKY